MIKHVGDLVSGGERLGWLAREEQALEGVAGHPEPQPHLQGGGRKAGWSDVGGECGL